MDERIKYQRFIASFISQTRAMSTQHFPGRSHLILPTPWASSGLGARRHIYHPVEPEIMYPASLQALSAWAQPTSNLVAPLHPATSEHKQTPSMSSCKILTDAFTETIAQKDNKVKVTNSSVAEGKSLASWHSTRIYKCFLAGHSVLVQIWQGGREEW